MKTFSEQANPWIGALGVYEPGKPIEEVAREMGFETPEDLVKLASNENALGPSPRAVAAMRQAAEGMHRYPDGGSYYLRKALARKLGVREEQILPGTGSNELIELIGHVFLAPGTNIVMADRAFVVYRLVAMAARAGVVSVAMRDLRHDLDAMAAAVTPATRIVFVANPNNPTGTMVTGGEIDRFVARLEDNVVICFDEAYVELLPPDRQPDTLRYVREGRTVIVLRTFSKSHGLAGLRIGYAAAPETCIELLNKVRQPFNVNAMAQVAAVAALEDDAHVERTRRMIQAGIPQMEDGLRRLGIPFVQTVVNFMLAEVGNGRQVFTDLQREGIIVRPMDGYGLPEHIRITIGTREENDKCLRALEKVRRKR